MLNQFDALSSQKRLKNWLDQKAYSHFAAESLINLIADPHSLTQRLRGLAKKHFKVKIIHTGWAKAPRAINQRLNNPCHQKMWQRSVLLMVDNEVFVTATTWMPQATLKGPGRQLLFLHQRPLGDLLFQDPTLKRSEFTWSAGRAIETITRSSIFYFYGQPLLVSETFSEKALATFRSLDEALAKSRDSLSPAAHIRATV